MIFKRINCALLAKVEETNQIFYRGLDKMLRQS